MQITLSGLQKEELKKELEKELFNEIERQKTWPYYFVRGIWYLLIVGFALGLFLVVDKIASTQFDGYSDNDNFDSCWINEDEQGFDKTTGEKAERQRHFDCSNFVKE